MPPKMPSPAVSSSPWCLLFPPLVLLSFLFPPVLEAFLISVASVFHPSSPLVLFCLLSLPSPVSHLASLPSHLSFPSFSFHLSPLRFLSQAFCSFSSLYLSPFPCSIAPFFSLPALPCVPALGDPLPIHHYFHGYLAGFSVRSGHLESREVIECLYACREGLDYRDFESLGKGMKV